MRHLSWKATALVAAVALSAGCGSSGSSSPTTSASTGSASHRGGTLTVLSNGSFGTADPAQNYTLGEWQLLIMTHDTLVGFKRVGGPAGNQIVPDLATSVPTPTNGGKTYTFTLHPGIKYSDGTPLKASDFVTVVKRQFTVPGPTTFYNGIVGAAACVKKPKACDLSKGVVPDNAAGTVTFNLTAPDPEFLDKLALPFMLAVPGSTPLTNQGNKVPPGTGPYMWQSYDPNKAAVLVRNPYFKQWSVDAQPLGNPDSIVEKFGLSLEDEVTEIENGQADVMFDQDLIPADRLNEVSTKYASQVHVQLLTADYYFALNVKVPPFNNLQARQAVNYAADRGAMVKEFGGPSLAAPTCQILPPNFPGYKPYCPYTAGTDTTKWTAPDLTKARQLVQQSGTKGAKVTIVGTTDSLGKSLALQLASDMNKIGYNATAKLLAAGPQYPFIQNSSNKIQVGYSQWFQDYPAASDFLNVLLGCGNFRPNSDASPNISEFCNKGIQANMNKAGALEATDPTGANNLWAQVDHQVTDQAAWVDMFNPKQIDFEAKRVHGYQWSPQWYTLLDQLWVK
jgi:peptide/nickel transport system substrate-binding protein